MVFDFFARASHGEFYPQLPRMNLTRNYQGVSHANGSKTIMSSNLNRQRHLPRSKRWTSSAARPEPISPQNARRNYERYLALARAEGQIGNTVGAENYYQYAEHYFRSMSSS